MIDGAVHRRLGFGTEHSNLMYVNGQAMLAIMGPPPSCVKQGKPGGE